MKKPKRTIEKKVAAPAHAARGVKQWPYVAAFAAGLVAVFIAYAPALNGPFVFDDMYLPFTSSVFAKAGVGAWIRSSRPLLMLSFWMNYHLSGLAPFSYHVVNVLLHFVTGLMAFLIARRLLALAGTPAGIRTDALAAFAGGVFLLHPVQTESIAYVASRSEALSVMFFYAAFAAFLYRRSEAISWKAAIVVLLLFGAAVSTKEHAAVLPALLLLTDYYWNPGFSFHGIRRNWRLYALIAGGAAIAARFVWSVLSASNTAGFNVKQFTWYEYLFTQSRVIWMYIRLFFLPYGQNVDHDIPISRTLFQHGAVFGLAALVIAVAAAIRYRRRYPLASYGFLAFLLLLAPTSSVLPIADPSAEHRLYLPFIGLLLVPLEFLRRWKASRQALAAALGGILVVGAWLTYQRSRVWSSDLALWSDSVSKSPRKMRPQFQLAYAYYLRGQCRTALQHYELAAQAQKPEYGVLVDWALADDCAGRWRDAIGKLREAAAQRASAHVYAVMGYVYGRNGQNDEAFEALAAAEKLDPNFVMTYIYRGTLFRAINDFPAAIAQFRRALSINPEDRDAQQNLALAEREAAGAR
jgi:tetratricopeptide (TPR) repeat protein